MRLIINQPLHPVERVPANWLLPPPATSRVVPETAALITVPRLLPALPQARTTGHMGVARPNGHTKPNGHNNVNGVSGSAPPLKPVPVPKPRPKVYRPTDGSMEAGPSRRPPSPTHASEPPKKRIKESMTSQRCIACDQALGHSLSQCPIVKGGPERFVSFADEAASPLLIFCSEGLR